MRKDSVPNRLKEIRKKKKITQIELSKITGISQSRLSLYEKGKQMSTDTLKRILTALDISADYFLGLVNKDK